MQDHDDDPFDTYLVVVNEEEQYSIWPAEKTLPGGWRAAGKQGPKRECLDYIAEVWTDMRPLSLRKKMEQWARNPPPPEPIESDADEVPSLVDRLSVGEHAVTFSGRPVRTSAALKDRIDLGYVHITFTDTRGGTELGLRVEPQASDLSAADFERGTGTVRLVGTLNLDYEDVRCVATIDLATLAGAGRLERVGAAAS